MCDSLVKFAYGMEYATGYNSNTVYSELWYTTEKYFGESLIGYTDQISDILALKTHNFAKTCLILL